MSRNRGRKHRTNKSVSRTAADSPNLDLDSGVYATIAALVETAFGPAEKLPDRCREFADMAAQFQDNSEMIIGLRTALATLLSRVKDSLSLTGNASLLDPDQLGVELARFHKVVGDAPHMSVQANHVLSLMVEHDVQSPFLKEVLTYMHAERGGAAGAFEVLTRLLPVVVRQHSSGTEWQHWHITSQLLAVTLPTRLS